MKKIRLNKPYLIEGVLLKKGTTLILKEVEQAQKQLIQNITDLISPYSEGELEVKIYDDADGFTVYYNDLTDSSLEIAYDSYDEEWTISKGRNTWYFDSYDDVYNAFDRLIKKRLAKLGNQSGAKIASPVTFRMREKGKSLNKPPVLSEAFKRGDSAKVASKLVAYLEKASGKAMDISTEPYTYKNSDGEIAGYLVGVGEQTLRINFLLKESDYIYSMDLWNSPSDKPDYTVVFQRQDNVVEIANRMRDVLEGDYTNEDD